ncbi:MAG TPA: hypothetical protein VHJ77_17110 [Vicinamibacterales bacterium]|jgi:hypothetical protein|nr:hypothetical protein [Vicinamibacterales bacterium]
MIRSSDRTRLWNAFITASILATLFACGGGNGSGGDNNGGGNTPPPATDPCATAAVEADAQEFGIEGQGSGRTWGPYGKNVPDGDVRWRVLDDVWMHRAGLTFGLLSPIRQLEIGPNAATEDIGEIAVLQDEGDLVLRPNQLDIRNIGLRWTRNGAGGYDVRKIDAAFRTNLGSRFTLDDDDSEPATLRFNFNYYGRTQSQAFINSDGNVTFEQDDRASTERNLTRVLTGPPRIAPFFADLDPTTGTGRVFVLAAADQFTVTWCNVRGFESQRTVTSQVTLLPDGVIEMKFAESVNLLDGIVALSPGRTGTFAAIDLSLDGPTGGGGAAAGERFAERGSLDTSAVAQKFYRTHGDFFDQLVIWTDQRLLRDAFAFETTVANEIRGIGIDTFDLARDFGSAGRLRSIAVMDALSKYPDDPTVRVPGIGENSTLSVLGQEVGHRWLAFLNFRDHNGRTSEALLGRGQAHWSFFFDSDASVMEGNDIEDLGGGSFRTVATVQRYSALDQYAMGLLRDSDVPPFFWVESPTNIVPNRVTEDGPQTGVTFNGTRRTVVIQDVIAVEGARQPSALESSRVHRQAFIYVTTSAATNQAEVAKLDNIRRQWLNFFSQATNGRMTTETRLRPPS